MHNLIRGVWIYGGEDELFIDSIRAFGEKFRDGWKAGGGQEEKVVLKLVKNNAHVGPVADFMTLREKSETRIAQEEWLKQQLV